MPFGVRSNRGYPAAMRYRSGVASAPRDSRTDAPFDGAWLTHALSVVLVTLLAGCAVGVGPDDSSAHRRDATGAADVQETPIDVVAAVDVVAVIDGASESAVPPADTGPSCGDGTCSAS